MAGNNFKKNRSGFTLMEILVVLGVFSILGVIIVNVFLLTLRSQQQTSLRQKTLANLRYVTEVITRQIRTSEVDYSPLYDLDGTEGIADFEKELYLIDQLGRELGYYLENGEVKLSIAGEVAPLTKFEEIEIVKLNFYITPTVDPFIEERCSDDSDCNDPTLGCSLSKICVGGTNDGKECTIAANCPGGSCLPPSFNTGFCICGSVSGDNNKCNITKFCKEDKRLNKWLCLPPEYQPRVTMVLGFKSVGTRIEEQKIIYLQTTASSRVYKR